MSVKFPTQHLYSTYSRLKSVLVYLSSIKNSQLNTLITIKCFLTISFCLPIQISTYDVFDLNTAQLQYTFLRRQEGTHPPVVITHIYRFRIKKGDRKRYSPACSAGTYIHSKKRLTSFPSSAGMSLTKLPLGRNNSVMTSLFPPRESLLWHPGWGRETREPFFTVYSTDRNINRHSNWHITWKEREWKLWFVVYILPNLEGWLFYIEAVWCAQSTTCTKELIYLHRGALALIFGTFGADVLL